MFPGRVEILEHDGYHVHDDGFLFQTGGSVLILRLPSQ